MKTQENRFGDHPRTRTTRQGRGPASTGRPVRSRWGCWGCSPGIFFLSERRREKRREGEKEKAGRINTPIPPRSFDLGASAASSPSFKVPTRGEAPECEQRQSMVGDPAGPRTEGARPELRLDVAFDARCKGAVASAVPHEASNEREQRHLEFVGDARLGAPPHRSDLSKAQPEVHVLASSEPKRLVEPVNRLQRIPPDESVGCDEVLRPAVRRPRHRPQDSLRVVEAREHVVAE